MLARESVGSISGARFASARIANMIIANKSSMPLRGEIGAETPIGSLRLKKVAIPRPSEMVNSVIFQCLIISAGKSTLTNNATTLQSGKGGSTDNWGRLLRGVTPALKYHVETPI